jgi:membrane protein implicated in regulation of membrane protease activity
VANAPGGPIHVLLSDEEAEHIPGCNMAFRREMLEEIGGFDPRFRVAGDDVDICWRVQDAGGTLGFSPAAFVWHHPRDSVATYWRQQCGYGRAEALLEEKWPEKYNSVGHVTWGGRVYGGARPWFLARQGRIYHGVWGEAPFQAFHPARPSFLGSLAATPEWYLVLLALAGIALVGVAWHPTFLALPLLALAAAPVLVQAALGGWRARFDTSGRSRYKRIGLRLMTMGLHLLQPAARLRGRLRHGLTPWRLRTQRRFIAPNPQTVFLWSESWANPSERLERLEFVLARMRAVVLRGGPFDDFDLLVKGGASGRVRIHTCTEEHGAGTQLIRVRVLPTLSRAGLVALALTGGLSLWAFLDGATVAGLMFALAMATVAVRGVLECGGAIAAVLEALDSMHAAEIGPDRRALERDARRVIEGGLGNGQSGGPETAWSDSPEGEDEEQPPAPAPLDPPDRQEAVG